MQRAIVNRIKAIGVTFYGIATITMSEHCDNILQVKPVDVTALIVAVVDGNVEKLHTKVLVVPFCVYD